jgi:acetyl-CoA synthetase
MLACARIGAIHSVVFGAFSEDSLRDRIKDSECKLLITQDTALRGKKNDIPMKAKADKAVAQCPSIENVVVVKRTGVEVPMQAAATSGTTRRWPTPIARVRAGVAGRRGSAVHPLHLRLDRQAQGRAAHDRRLHGLRATTFKYIFDYHDGDIWWCTADIGWVTGHTTSSTARSANGATSVMFEGVPDLPRRRAASGTCRQVQGHAVLHGADGDPRADARGRGARSTKRDLSSLKLLGRSASRSIPRSGCGTGDHVGKERCPVVDTWWQTETGGILITPLPGAHTLKPGSASRPFFGVEPVIVDDNGKPVPAGPPASCASKALAGHHAHDLRRPRALRADVLQRLQGPVLHGRRLPRGRGRRLLAAGPRGRRDQRLRPPLGTAEVESALVSHPAVAEAAVVGYPHDIKGQGIYAYVTLKTGFEPTTTRSRRSGQARAQTRSADRHAGRHPVGAGLPKTRSGKIMRRILRKIAESAPPPVSTMGRKRARK